MNIPVTVVVFRNEQRGAKKKNDILWFDERFVGSELGRPLRAGGSRSCAVASLWHDATGAWGWNWLYAWLISTHD